MEMMKAQYPLAAMAEALEVSKTHLLLPFEA
jgi:hypothetical protein